MHAQAYVHYYTMVIAQPLGRAIFSLQSGIPLAVLGHYFEKVIYYLLLVIATANEVYTTLL